VIATHSVFGFEVANDRLDSLAAFEPVSIMLLIRLVACWVSSGGACGILAMGNCWFLPGNRPHDRSFLQSIKVKPTTLLRKVNGLRIFQSR